MALVYFDSSAFVKLLVEEEGSLAPLFGGTVSKEHRDHVLVWWVEVMGGPADYTASLGGYPAMLAHHRGLAITPEQRRLFVNLLSQAADEVDLPADPELRAALIGYAEWGSRLAVHNSAPDAGDIKVAASASLGCTSPALSLSRMARKLSSVAYTATPPGASSQE